MGPYMKRKRMIGDTIFPRATMIMGERVPPKTENFYTQNQEKIGRDDPPSKN